MPEVKILAQRSREIRREMRESQIEFAYHCGICTETLSLIEREKADPRLSTVQKIAAYTNRTGAELLDLN